MCQHEGYEWDSRFGMCVGKVNIYIQGVSIGKVHIYIQGVSLETRCSDLRNVPCACQHEGYE